MADKIDRNAADKDQLEAVPSLGSRVRHRQHPRGSRALHEPARTERGTRPLTRCRAILTGTFGFERVAMRNIAPLPAQPQIAQLTDVAREMVEHWMLAERAGETHSLALAHHVVRCCPEVETVIASERVAPEPGDMSDKAAFIPKPFSAQVVYDYRREKLPHKAKPATLRVAI
jgi:hypothetical protein